MFDIVDDIDNEDDVEHDYAISSPCEPGGSGEPKMCKPDCIHAPLMFPKSFKLAY